MYSSSWTSLAVVALVCAFSTGCTSAEPEIPAELRSHPIRVRSDDIAVRSLEIIRTIPHRPSAWTQGLLIRDGKLVESTGLVGRSELAVINLRTGDIDDVVPVDPDLYAEGLALVDGQLIQLTWKDGVALVYDADTLERTGEHRYEGQGWGLCFDGTRLVMSDGSAELTYRDPDTFEELGSVTVKLNGQEVPALNELECVDGRVFANVWHTAAIVEIDAKSGDVVSVLDAGPLMEQLSPPVQSSESALNGIAYSADTKTLWLTGKLWPQLFEVRIASDTDL